MIEFEGIQEMYDVYREPCNNCTLYIEGAFCDKGHRQKKVSINTGHIPELEVRKKSGCSDHILKVGDWWGEEPISPFSDTYGGTNTNIMV